MPFLKHQPVSPIVGAEGTGGGAVQFRHMIVLAFAAGALASSGVAAVEHGVASWAAAVIALCIAGSALYRLSEERALLGSRAIAMATVTHWEESEGLEGGRFYSVQYRFFGADGKGYVGRATSPAELPQVGAVLPVSYNHVDPTQNLPLATFWFFRFTYTGFARWAG